MTSHGKADSRCATCSHRKFEHGGRRRDGGGSSPRCIIKGCVCPGYVSTDSVKRAQRPKVRQAPQGTQTGFFSIDSFG